MEALKKAVAEAMVKTYGNITKSCEAAGISRQTFYDWKKDDQEFRSAIEGEDYEERLMDFVESKLIKKAESDDTAVIIFMAKTKCKKRGYVERQEHTGPDGENLFINFRTVGNNANGPVYETKQNGTLTKSGLV